MQTMSPEEVRQFLGHARLGVLGLADEGRAYGVPLFFGWDGRSFYFHGKPGRKDAYAQATTEACLTVVSAQSEDVWTSVMAFGRVEPVTVGEERRRAADALLAVPLPPEFGVSETGEPARGPATGFWKLTPERITGRKSVRPFAEEWAARGRA